ncbi:hypothetical protein [Actinoplanes sp. NPDC049265]|uniref:hypothetical protein n=1 Tax=Actinoplanes sp. NPDC049265 TaxID=3363902 RepID=UPI00370FF383
MRTHLLGAPLVIAMLFTTPAAQPHGRDPESIAGDTDLDRADLPDHVFITGRS